MSTLSYPSDVESSSRLGDWVLGTDPRQRLRIRRSLVSMWVYLAVIVLRWVGVAYDVVPLTAAWVTTLYDVLGLSGFYLLMRSGWSLRLRDPAMTLAQILFALSAVTVAYALIEASRGAALQFLCLILMFGMFRLTPAQVLGCGLLAGAMLGTTLGVMWHTRVPGVDLEHEALNVALAVIVLPMLAYIGQQVSSLRRRQIRQGQELATALERLQDLATRDALTGLMNRRHMLDMLTEALKRYSRSGRGFAVAMLDVDYFKRINDSHGHPVGDAVLAGLAREAQAGLRQSDLLARWGGEEFLLLMPDTSLEGARVPVERIRTALAACDWSEVLPADEKVSVSIGVAAYGPGEPLEQTLARADEALYRAKSGGRDRVCLAADVQTGA